MMEHKASLQAANALPHPQVGIYVIFLGHAWLPKNKGKGKNKWLTERAHGPAGPKSPSALHSDVGNR